MGEAAVFATDFDETGDASDEEEENAEEDGGGDESGYNIHACMNAGADEVVSGGRGKNGGAVCFSES